ncbi:hypothetical protein [Methanolacinia petrolearia]|uniref:hypothetical protein n=1 Tax=Methanolacinia petrolearia TaxID=54120 RepID=UPI003BAD33D1
MIFFFYLCAGLSILLTSFAQILLKIGASKTMETESIYLNKATIGGYVVLLIVTLLSVLALQGIELKIFYAAAYSLNIILVAILSSKILKESFSQNKTIGILIIAIGIIIFNI